MAITITDIINSDVNDPKAIVLYGINGIGKTTFASQAPGVVFIFTEQGIGKLKGLHRFPLAEAWSDVDEALTVLHTQEHEHKTLAVDSIDWLERLIWERVATDENKTHISEIGFGKGYERALHYWHQFLKKCDLLRKDKRMNIILIGHSLIKTYNSPDSESYDRYRLDLHDKAASAIRDWADIILFADYKKYLTDSADGKRKIPKGNGARVIYTEERPSHWAKNRFGLPYELPLDFEVFREALAK